jgi:molybdopterin converting factor small subunit
MKITVEFTGIARSLTKTHQVLLEVDENTSVKEVIKLLATKFPGLVNVIISPDGESLLNSNVFFINGSEMLMPDDANQRLQEGDQLTLLSIIVGGYA